MPYFLSFSYAKNKMHFKWMRIWIANTILYAHDSIIVLKTDDNLHTEIHNLSQQAAQYNLNISIHRMKEVVLLIAEILQDQHCDK